MLLALLVLQLAAAFANPFHKYPYVFLLDIGNEELEKVNTEQIRISKQGGSLALRYPAIGDGDDIAHVRVSGIDFGTDLKANIVDGGPGYKYVVLVLMGNPGVDFDAVITIQTVPSQNNDGNSLQSVEYNPNAVEYQVTEDGDPNDSAEDFNDSAESEKASQVSVVKENAEFTQESSNVYSYAQNEALSGYGGYDHSSDNDDSSSDEDIEGKSNENDSDEQKDIHKSYNEDLYETDEDDEDNGAGEDQSLNIERQVPNYDYASDDSNQPADSNYNRYEVLKSNLYDDEEVPQEGISDDSDSDTVYIDEPDKEGSINLEEIFSDEYDADDGNGYNRNSDMNNNNFIDGSEDIAVAY